MPGKVDEFNVYRTKINEKLLANSKLMKWIFNLNTNAFMAGSDLWMQKQRSYWIRSLLQFYDATTV